ncbi:MAG: NAD(P)-dependent glycerol-1-phosphate dehydrogenase [Sulfolobales archaeon]
MVLNAGKHVIDLPKKVVIGEGVIESVPKVAEELRIGRKCLLVSGPNVMRLVGERLVSLMSDYGMNVEEAIVDSPTSESVEEVLNVADGKAFDFVVGVGGGKVIDVSKYVANYLKTPFISVPTAASHDGVASPFSSIRGTGSVVSVRSQTPIAIVADISVIGKAPRRLLLAGSGDLIGKFTAVLDWRLAHRLKGEYYGGYSASLALLSAKHVINYSDLISRGSPEGVRIVVEGLISSSVAMCIAGSTRPASGSEHLFSHALDLVANYPALHGEQVALGTIMMGYLHGRDWRKLALTVRKLGLPTTAKELGIPEVKIIEALTIAHKIRPERYTILGESGLTWEAAERVAMITGVIS